MPNKVRGDLIQLVHVEGGMPFVLLKDAGPLCCKCPNQLWAGTIVESQSDTWIEGQRAIWSGNMQFLALPFEQGEGLTTAIAPVCILIAREQPRDPSELN